MTKRFPFRAALAATLLFGVAVTTGCGDKTPPEPSVEPGTLSVNSSTTRMPCAGVLETEFADSPLGFGLSKLVDGNLNSHLASPHGSFYILWKGRESRPVNYYSLTSSAGAPENDPKSWSLSGSNDNKEWTLLDRQTDVVFASRKQKLEYNLDNTSSWRYIKLQIEANGGASTTHIAEYSLLYSRLDIDDLMAKASGFTKSGSTPMGRHFENRHVTTDGDKTWLADPANEPLASNAGQAKLMPFGVTLYPSSGGNPSPWDANQHGVGDCCAIAVFSSMAYLYPDFINSIITDNGNQTFTVKMFDPQGKPVEVCVSNAFPAGDKGGIEAVTGKSNVACWSTVLEKAMLKWQHIYRVNYSINGIGTEFVSPLFTGTGESFAFGRGVLNATELKRAVEVCLRRGKIVVGGFDPGDVPVDGTKTVTGHAYTFMLSGTPTALFLMRNPWGGNPDVSGAADGVVRVPADEALIKLIDIRVVDPGEALQFSPSKLLPYNPPRFSRAEARMRVSAELMRTGR